MPISRVRYSTEEATTLKSLPLSETLFVVISQDSAFPSGTTAREWIRALSLFENKRKQPEEGRIYLACMCSLCQGGR
jgi:hypothetical protein